MGSNRYRILLIEDEENIRTFVSVSLEANGYTVITAGSVSEAEILFKSYTPDIVILDLGLPDCDGTVFLRRIRNKELTPVIILSARSSEYDKVSALDMGANDYITKPFSSAELCARIRATLRYSCHSAPDGRLPGGKFVLNDLEIDYEARTVSMNKHEIRLTQTEFNILAYLSEHCGKVMTYASIINTIWKETPDENSIKKLQVNMANARRKLGIRPGENIYIVNELGIGYRMKS